MAKKKKVTAKKKAKSKYKAHYPEIVEWLASKGLLHKEIAEELKVSRMTLHRWAKEYPGMRYALKKGSDWIDKLVEGSLLKRAMGHGAEETKNVMSRNQDGKPFLQKVEKTTKQIAPDVVACIFWLKNRQPDRWRDVQHKEHSGEVKGGFNVIIQPEEKDV